MQTFPFSYFAIHYILLAAYAMQPKQVTTDDSLSLGEEIT